MEKLADMDGKSAYMWPYYHVVRCNGTGLNPDDLELFQDWEESDKIIWEKLAGDIVVKLNKIREQLISTN